MEGVITLCSWQMFTHLLRGQLGEPGDDERDAAKHAPIAPSLAVIQETYEWVSVRMGGTIALQVSEETPNIMTYTSGGVQAPVPYLYTRAPSAAHRSGGAWRAQRPGLATG